MSSTLKENGHEQSSRTIDRIEMTHGLFGNWPRRTLLKLNQPLSVWPWSVHDCPEVRPTRGPGSKDLCDGQDQNMEKSYGDLKVHATRPI